jgi:hypothetical protein
VDCQHRHLLAGGRLGTGAVEAAAARFRELLGAGRTAEVERQLRPGVGFAVQVQALATLDHPEAGRLLENQLARRLTRDAVEQTWYWADVAAGLRHLGHVPALPAVLRCADAAAGLPAETVLAAEAVAFPNFAAALADPASPIGRAALRAACTVARGCREGTVHPECVLRAGLAAGLAALSEAAPESPDPWLAAALIEAQRLSRRIGHWGRLLGPEDARLAEWQGARLRETAGRRGDRLRAAPARLLARFPIATTAEQAAILRCLYDFRADVTRLFPHLPDRRVPWWADAVRALTWSKSAAAGPVLAGQAVTWLNSRRGRWRAAVLLAALRGHPGPEAEQALLRGAIGADAAVQRAAAGALGWWPPVRPAPVLGALRGLCTDPDPQTRRTAVAALARLGDRAALRELADGLAAEDPGIRAAVVRAIAGEGVSWLWPDVQGVAESEDPATALPAVEAVEHLREQALGVPG